MSGYRSLHRESVGSYPIWQIATSPVLTKTTKPNKAPSWRVWTACGDGLVRGYLVQEKTLETQKDVLDASACTFVCTHVLLGQSQELDDASSSMALGYSQIRLARNYVGDDDMAGDLLVVAMDLSGAIRIWSLPEDMDEEIVNGDQSSPSPTEPTPLKADQEFLVPNATGTCVQICPPKVSGVGDVSIAVACLDGTVAVVATGISTPKATKDPTEVGTVMDVWSKTGSIAMSGDWHPSKRNLAIGRQDGLVEIMGKKPHRLIHHEAPVRAVSFTPDGNLLMTGSDDGMLAVWDVSRAIPVLVHHVVQAHASWILSMTALADSRRFISCGADRRLHVWSVGQMDQSMHSFTCDDTVWTIHAATTQQRTTANAQKQPPRLVSGSEHGGIQIYSLEA
jgi:WD40 repeat protein